MKNLLTRRTVLIGAATAATGCQKTPPAVDSGRRDPPQTSELRPTPSATHDHFDGPPPGGPPPAGPAASCRPTEPNIEGPFYLPGAPHRAVLVTDSDKGERLHLSGRILGVDCRPIAGVVLEIWQADATGAYDTSGPRFRGTLETNARGEWAVDTIVPGRYLNGSKYRPAHIHAKLHGPALAPLTTQLYFEGDPENVGDPFIAQSLVMKHRVEKGVRIASFDFVVGAG